jgi:plastocyanin
MSRPRLALLALLAVVLASGAACSSSSKSTTASTASTATTSSAASGGALAVTIKSLTFSPATLAAKVGDTVTVTNQDGFAHTFTADDGSFDTGSFASGSKTVKLTKAGTIAYHCNIHSSMHGTLQVS